MQEKPELRRKLLALRNTIPAEEKTAFDRRIGDAILASWQTARDTTIGVYWPMRSEPDLPSTSAALRREGVQPALPVVVDDNAPLKFVLWKENAVLQDDRYGARIPPASNSQVWPQV